MDWSDSPQQATFRREVREFVRAELPQLYVERAREGRDGGWEGGWRADRVSADPAVSSAAQNWAEALARRGWIAPH